MSMVYGRSLSSWIFLEQCYNYRSVKGSQPWLRTGPMKRTFTPYSDRTFGPVVAALTGPIPTLPGASAKARVPVPYVSMGMGKSGQTSRRYATGSLSFILYRSTTGLDVSVCVAPPPLGLSDFSHCLGADFIFLFLTSSKTRVLRSRSFFGSWVWPPGCIRQPAESVLTPLQLPQHPLARYIMK